MRQNRTVLPEVRLRLTPAKYLVPDLAVVEAVEQPYPIAPPTLCIEILSPDSRLSAMFGKCEDYHAWGVPYCWVVDPTKRLAWEYHRQQNPMLVEAAGTLVAGTMEISMAEFLQMMDEKLNCQR